MNFFKIKTVTAYRCAVWHRHSYLVPVLWLVLAFWLIATLSACTPKDARDIDSRADTNHLGTAVLHEPVLLDKASVLSIKPERFQPSFELSGIVLPHLRANLVAPIDGVVSQIHHSENDPLKKDEAIITLSPIKAMDSDVSSVAIAIKAPFDGVLHALYPTHGTIVKAGDSVATVYDERFFEFVSILPKNYEPYLKIGMVVNFTADANLGQRPDNARLDDITKEARQSFTGQVSAIAPNQGNQISVTVQILPNDDNDVALSHGMRVSGRVDFGQLQVGALVPRQAIISDKLALLDNPPFKPTTRMTAKIWVIKQNGRLSLSDVDIIEYQPDTQRYLVHGLTQDSLITDATLPKMADGMLVRIKP